MGDVISYPDVSRDDRDGQVEGRGAEGGYAELEKLFLKLKEEAGGDREIRGAGLDIPLADEDTIKRLEAEGNGIWATVNEYAKGTGTNVRTLYNRIKKNKYHVKKGVQKERYNSPAYYIWVTNKNTKNIIITDRNVNSVEIKIVITKLETHKINEIISEGQICEAENGDLILRRRITLEKLNTLVNDKI